MSRYFIVLLLTLQATVAIGQDKKKADGSDKASPSLPDRKVTYKQVGEKSYQLHVFDPVEREGSDKPRACVVFFFGGGWKSGEPKQFYTHCRTLADLGMVAMSAEYRVSSRDNSKVIDCIADAQDAIAYVREHAKELNIDSDRIAAAGGSAGGHLAAGVATLAYRGKVNGRTKKDYRPNALILFNPAVAIAPTGGARDQEMETLTKGMRERVGDDPVAASPFHHMDKDLPPTIIFHGKADTTVPYWTVEKYRNKATDLGTRCKLVGYPDQPHGFFNLNRPMYQEVLDEMVGFMRELQYVR